MYQISVIEDEDSDIQAVENLLIESRNFDLLSDDFTPKIIEMRNFINMKDLVLIKVRVEGNVVGVFLFRLWNTITWEIHSCIGNSYRGKRAVDMCIALGHFVFSQFPVIKLVTQVPVYNLPAYALARKLHMVVEGLNSKSWMKDGKVWDQHLLGITKEEFTCHFSPQYQ